METEVQRAKADYNDALQNLEKISDEIHKLREDQKLNEYHEDEVRWATGKAQRLRLTRRLHFQLTSPAKASNKTYLCYQNSLSDDYELVDDEDENQEANESEPQVKPPAEWSEIPLNSMSESNSTASSYSQQSDQNDGEVNAEASGSNEKEAKDDEKKSGSGFTDWISKSSFRRQSLEDVFAQSTLFGKFGRSLERRNSESEVEMTNSSSSNKKEFFLFGRHEGLTDSQIENLFLPPEHL